MSYEAPSSREKQEWSPQKAAEMQREASRSLLKRKNPAARALAGLSLLLAAEGTQACATLRTFGQEVGEFGRNLHGAPSGELLSVTDARGISSPVGAIVGIELRHASAEETRRTERAALPLPDPEVLAGDWWNVLRHDQVYQDGHGQFYLELEQALRPQDEARGAHGYNDRRLDVLVRAESRLRDCCTHHPSDQVQAIVMQSHHVPGSRHRSYLVRAVMRTSIESSLTQNP